MITIIMIETIKQTIYSFVDLFGIYLLWICLHYAASQLYVPLCAPNDVKGFVLSPFIAPAPHCQALRWLIYNGGNSISAMWIIFGTWCLSYLSPIRRKHNYSQKQI